MRSAADDQIREVIAIGLCALVAVWICLNEQLWLYLPTPGNLARDSKGVRLFGWVLAWTAVVGTLAAIVVRSESAGTILTSMGLTGVGVYFGVRSLRAFFRYKRWAESERGLEYQAELALLEERSLTDSAAAQVLARKLRAEVFDLEVHLSVLSGQDSPVDESGRTGEELEQRLRECRQRLARLPSPDTEDSK